MSRSRELKQEFFVSKSELEIIKKRMEIMGVTNKSVFYRKMVLDGFMIRKDYDALRELSREVNKIGVNINQVVHLVNGKNEADREDVAKLQERMDEVWQLLKSTLSKQI